jgi:hypothetical protein
VSYQWAAERSPGDLDCLVGVDYIGFRADNPDYQGLSDVEISRMLNAEFRQHIMNHTGNWNGYELTYYVNPHASDIRSIAPYAAYDLTGDEWTVHPDENAAPPTEGKWAVRAEMDRAKAEEIVKRYSSALTELQNAQNPAHRVNAERRLHYVLEHAADLYDDIHEGRHLGFSMTGEGYASYSNYRWQAGKQSGAIDALKRLKQYRDDMRESTEVQTYGTALAEADDLILRAATHYAVGSDW